VVRALPIVAEGLGFKIQLVHGGEEEERRPTSLIPLAIEAGSLAATSHMVIMGYGNNLYDLRTLHAIILISGLCFSTRAHRIQSERRYASEFVRINLLLRFSDALRFLSKLENRKYLCLLSMYLSYVYKFFQKD